MLSAESGLRNSLDDEHPAICKLFKDTVLLFLISTAPQHSVCTCTSAGLQPCALDPRLVSKPQPGGVVCPPWLVALCRQ